MKRNKKKERNLKNELKNASERFEGDILLAEQLVKKIHPDLYTAFVAFNRHFIGKRAFYNTKIQWLQDAWDSIPEIMDALGSCEEKISKIEDHLFGMLETFEKEKTKKHTLETAAKQLDLFSRFAEKSEMVQKEYDDIVQHFVDALNKIRQFIADYDNTYAAEIALLKDQAKLNHTLFNLPVLNAAQEILNKIHTGMQTAVKKAKKNIVFSEKEHQRHVASRLDPQTISVLKALDARIKSTIEKMTAIRDGLATKKSQEEHARIEAENQARTLQRKQLDKLVAEIEIEITPQPDAIEYKGTIENAFTQHLTTEAEKTKTQGAQLDSVGTEKEKIDIFFQHFLVNIAELKNMSEAAICDIANCFYRARLQYFNVLSKALSSVIDAVDGVSNIEHIDQIATRLYQEYQEALCNVLIQHNALPNAIVIAKLLLKSAIQDKSNVNSFFQSLISERVSRFEGNVRIDAKIFMGSPAYQIAQTNPVLNASGILQEIEKFYDSTSNNTMQQPQPIARLCYLFDMKCQLATLTAGTPTTNPAEAHNTLSESEPQRPAAPTFKTLVPGCAETFRQDSTLLAFLGNLDAGNISFKALANFVTTLGSTWTVTTNNHALYLLPNIWASAVTNTTLTLASHGHIPDANINISDQNALATIRREFAAAGLTASLIREAMDNLNQPAVFHPS